MQVKEVPLIAAVVLKLNICSSFYVIVFLYNLVSLFTVGSASYLHGRDVFCSCQSFYCCAPMAPQTKSQVLLTHLLLQVQQNVLALGVNLKVDHCLTTVKDVSLQSCSKTIYINLSSGRDCS